LGPSPLRLASADFLEAVFSPLLAGAFRERDRLPSVSPISPESRQFCLARMVTEQKKRFASARSPAVIASRISRDRLKLRRLWTPVLTGHRLSKPMAIGSARRIASRTVAMPLWCLRQNLDSRCTPTALIASAFSNEASKLTSPAQWITASANPPRRSTGVIGIRLGV